MIIFFGSRFAHLITRQSKTLECPNCGKIGHIKNSVLSEHVHLFWIPLLPIGKESVSKCENCQYTMNIRNMTAVIRKGCNELEKETRPPIWQYSGLALIGLLIVYLIYYMQNLK